MKRRLLFFLLGFIFVANVFSQQGVFKTQGVPRPDITPDKQSKSSAFRTTQEDMDFTFDNIKFWVGEGENQAMLVIDWYDDKGPALVWGYRWDGEATGQDMVLAIAAADPRLTYMGGNGTIGGLGYDVDNNGSGCVIKGMQEECPVDGIIDAGGYNYDGWEIKDPSDHWQSGWMSGYWSYHTKDDIADEFEYSNFGIASRQLQNGSVDGWGYQIGWESWTGMVPRAPYMAAPMPETGFTFDNIKYWIGSGSNQTALAIKWNNWKKDDGFVWGYRWDGDKTVLEMLKDIAKTDERLYLLLCEEAEVILGGIAFDIDGKKTNGLVYKGNTTYPLYPEKGIVYVKENAADYDSYAIIDKSDYWSAGRESFGIWEHWTKRNGSGSFTKSSGNIMEEQLVDGIWNGFNFDVVFGGSQMTDKLMAVSPYEKKTIDYTKGIFFINEDWFGHTTGSVNFRTEEGEWIYRVYAKENPEYSLGATTSFGTVYGDNLYLVSKLAGISDKENRLVVADAKTLKRKAGFGSLEGDGRSFLGVDETTGYVGTSSGIILFDIEDLALGKKIEGTTGGSAYSGQIGTMLRIGDYVFACKQSAGVIVIDARTHEFVKTIECKNIGSIVQSKDGSLWATAYSEGLWKIDPYTFEVVEKREIPTNALIPGSWGAWAPSLICASDKTNTLYWAKMNGNGLTFFGTEVYKYDIDNPDVSAPFYKLTRAKEAFYGSALGIDPITENLIILTTQSGYGSNYQYNWVHFVNSETGDVVEIKQLDDYYWFPSMPAFPDNHPPVISDSFSNLNIAGLVKISLLDKVTDLDNRDAAIVKKVELLSGETVVRASVVNDSLVLQPLSKGSAKIKLTANSNGKIVSKDVDVNVTGFISVESISLDKLQIEMEEGETFRLMAMLLPVNASNKTVIWSSSNQIAATVDQNGMITALVAGKSATITATTEDGEKIAECKVKIIGMPVAGISLDVEEATLDARTSQTLQLVATVLPENAENKTIQWSSSDANVVTVDANGLVTAINDGEAEIKAVTEEGGFEATCNITVYTSVRRVNLNAVTQNVAVGETFQLIPTVLPENATNKNIASWVSSEPEVAGVDENGLVIIHKEGLAVITATTEDGGKQAGCTIIGIIPVKSVSIAPETSELIVGNELQLTATIMPENASIQTIRSWESSNPEIATVDEKGLVTAIAGGEAIITVTTQSGEKTATSTIVCIVPVTGISVTPESTALKVSEELQLEAVVMPENATNKNVVWTSNNPEVAVVDENGLVNATGGGEVTITATTEDGKKTATSVITCTVPVANVEVTPEATELYIDAELQLVAIVLPANATNKNIKTWISENSEIATVSNTGLVKAISAGKVKISVVTEDGEKEAYCELVVKTGQGIDGSAVILAMVYPTVTTNTVTVKMQDIQPITVANSQGHLIKTILPLEHKTEIDLSTYPEGIYLIVIGNQTFKIIKK